MKILFSFMPKNGGKMSQVEKEIYFYRVDTGKDASGMRLSFNPLPVVNHINTLGFPKNVSDKSRYWKDTADNNDVYGFWKRLFFSLQKMSGRSMNYARQRVV